MPQSIDISAHGNDPWLLLRALTLFRMLSCLFFLGAPLLIPEQPFIAQADHTQLLTIGSLYLLAGCSMGLLYWRRAPNLSTQVCIQVYVDIVFVTLLMHELGGVGSGIGILLCASLSATALLRQTHLSYLFAAIATLAVLGQTLLEQLENPATMPHYPQAAALCIALFVVSVLSAHFNKHRIASTAVIVDQQKRLAGLQSLSNEILRQFDHGLLAVTDSGQIVHSNPAALRLLGCHAPRKSTVLEDISPALSVFIARDLPAGSIKHGESALYVTAKHMAGDVHLLTLMAQSQQDAESHQLKLATLGQWTASVAHEIRNPLSAITQASQLLDESSDQSPLQRRLADIISRNSHRIDLIVTDILSLAKPSRALTQQALKPWLDGLATELRTIHGLPPSRLSVMGSASICESIDKNKLRHVIENLCKNSLAHGDSTAIEIRMEVLLVKESTVIRLSDNGSGIPPELQARLFDPFCANASGGTGLGLFIAREICEQHHIELSLCESTTGAVFELRFRPQITEQQVA